MDDLALVDQNDGILWKAYTNLLNSSHIRLFGNHDNLAWIFAKLVNRFGSGWLFRNLNAH